MRASDLYFGLMGVVFGFAALIVGLDKLSYGATAGFLVAAVFMLGMMAWRYAHTPRVVLVGEHGRGRLTRLDDALDHAGLSVCTCEGPGAHPCPVLNGQPCPIRGRLEAAVIATSAAYDGPVPPCGSALRVPVVNVVAGSTWDVTPLNGNMVVGDKLGLRSVAAVVRDVATQPRA